MRLLQRGSLFPEQGPPYNQAILGIVLDTYFEERYILLAISGFSHLEYMLVWRHDAGERELFHTSSITGVRQIVFEPYVFKMIYPNCPVKVDDCFALAKLVAGTHEKWLEEQTLKALEAINN